DCVDAVAAVECVAGSARDECVVTVPAAESNRAVLADDRVVAGAGVDGHESRLGDDRQRIVELGRAEIFEIFYVLDGAATERERLPRHNTDRTECNPGR